MHRKRGSSNMTEAEDSKKRSIGSPTRRRPQSTTSSSVATAATIATTASKMTVEEQFNPQKPSFIRSKPEIINSITVPTTRAASATTHTAMQISPSESISSSSGDGSKKNDANSPMHQNTTTASTTKTNNNNNDDKTSKDYYFDSYSHHGIHEEMLKDDVRTRTYQTAILNNKHLFKDKIVLDVGCGTGILSMFAAQAGASQVYAVDCSSIITQAQQVISHNKLDNVITVIQGKVEDITLPVDTVDIIISEWMGYFLLYESMLPTVLYARDKWLIKDGIIFPDKAVMHICAIEDSHYIRERVDFWNDVYGFDMSSIKELALKEPVVDIVDPKSVLTNSTPILDIDILTCTKDDLQFTSNFTLTAQRNDYIHGFVSYFECAFTQLHKPIGFSTSPFCKYTHWKQTIFYMKECLTICQGENVHGRVSCVPNKNNPRDLDIDFKIKFDGKYSKLSDKFCYRLR